MIEFLADSDFLISYLKGRDVEVSLLNPLIQQGTLSTSIIVYAEIYEGLLEARAAETYRQALVEVLSGVTVLGLDVETAQVFATIRSQLRGQGQLIADHDLWIAASALRHNLTLVSSDRHFERITKPKRHPISAG